VLTNTAHAFTELYDPKETSSAVKVQTTINK